MAPGSTPNMPAGLLYGPEFELKLLKVGANRVNLTPQELQLRISLMNYSQTFGALTEPDSVWGYLEGHRKYKPIVEEAVDNLLAKDPEAGASMAQQYPGMGTGRETMVKYFLAKLAKESNFKEHCKSGTGPVCPAGISERLAKDKGLVIDLDDPSKDERRDPKIAVRTMVEYDYDNYRVKQFRKRWDIVAFAYHAGPGLDPQYHNGVSGLLELADQEGLKWQSLDDLFFCDRFKYPKTANRVQEFMTKDRDFGMTYAFGVRRSMELLQLAWDDPETFKVLARLQRKQDSPTEVKLCKDLAEAERAGDGGKVKEIRQRLADPSTLKEVGGAANAKFWSAYSCRDLNFYTLQDIKNAIKRGELVALPPEGVSGLSLRPADKRGIGEKDPENAYIYQHLSREGWGFLFMLVYHYRQFNPKGVLDLTSLVRSWAYQSDVRKTGLPTHAMGRALDIAWKGLSDKDKDTLVYLLNEFEQAGYISWYLEPLKSEVKDHAHIVILNNQKMVDILKANYQLIMGQ
jgi:hypothetical protein